MQITPIFQSEAKKFIGRHHRHNVAPVACVFCIGLKDELGELIGVATAEVPKARLANDGLTLEITRVCVLDGHRNANSMLYGACARVAAGLGWKRLVTFTLPEESGSSLKACGWVRDEEMTTGGSWYRSKRSSKTDEDLFGNKRRPEGPKVRWKKELP